MWKSLLRSTHAGFDLAILAVGAALGVSPWLFGFVDEVNAAWNSWICGSLLALVALIGLWRQYDWTEWVAAACAVWAALSPWTLSYVSAAALWSHVVAGVAAFALATVRLWMARRMPPAKAA